MTKANNDLRKAAREAKVPFWAIANRLNISEPTMTRRLRCELSEAEKQTILRVIREISASEVHANE